MNTNFIIVCPHCNEEILIEQINCAIFRHAVFKSNNVQLNPHASKEICDKAYQNGEIYGCSKPFKIIKENDKYIAISCDYI